MSSDAKPVEDHPSATLAAQIASRPSGDIGVYYNGPNLVGDHDKGVVYSVALPQMAVVKEIRSDNRARYCRGA